MKTKKLAKGIQINLITVFLVILSFIILGIIFNNKSVATGTCQHCGKSISDSYASSNNSTYHTWTCDGCGQTTNGSHTGATHYNRREMHNL